MYVPQMLQTVVAKGGTFPTPSHLSRSCLSRKEPILPRELRPFSSLTKITIPAPSSAAQARPKSATSTVYKTTYMNLHHEVSRKGGMSRMERNLIESSFLMRTVDALADGIGLWKSVWDMNSWSKLPKAKTPRSRDELDLSSPDKWQHSCTQPKAVGYVDCKNLRGCLEVSKSKETRNMNEIHEHPNIPMNSGFVSYRLAPVQNRRLNFWLSPVGPINIAKCQIWVQQRPQAFAQAASGSAGRHKPTLRLRA